MKPTKLYPVNAKCDSVNSTELGKLTSDSVPFVSVDWGHSPYLENLKVCIINMSTIISCARTN